MDPNNEICYPTLIESRPIDCRESLPHTRLSCTHPFIIKGFNAQGEHYDELALSENISRRGICLRAKQPLQPGSIVMLYASEDVLDPLATIQIIWVQQLDRSVIKAGAQLIGDNYNWQEFIKNSVMAVPMTGRTATAH